MVNTVGSYESKHCQKKWLAIKRSAVITSLQKSLIVGSMLGDATMRMGEGAVNANFKIEHGLMQKEYVMWKYEILKPLVLTQPNLSFRYKENGLRYAKSWWFRTIRHRLFTEIYVRFYTRNGYKCGKKIISEEIKDAINPVVLAVWIMDDGSYSRGKIDISTYSFSLPEIQLLQAALVSKYDIHSNFYKDRNKGFRMYFNIQETKKIVKVIYPYIIPTMKYKIGFHNPVTT